MTIYEYILSVKDQATSKMKEMASWATTVDNRMDETTRSVANLDNRSKGLGSTFRSVAGFAASIGVALSAWQIGSSVVQLGVEAEQTQVKFETLLGSVEKAKTLIADIQDFANVTPYSKSDLEQGTELMLNFGLAQDKALNSIKMLSDVAAGNKQKLQSLSLAYAQMQSAGRLMGQDLLQMINAGFNPLQIIAEKTGLSMAELKKQMEAGAISSQMVTEAFRIATSEGGRFYQMNEKISQTVGGQWSTLKDQIKSEARKIGIAILPLATKFIQFTSWVVSGVSAIIQNLKTLGGWVNENKLIFMAFGIIITAVYSELILLNGAIAIEIIRSQALTIAKTGLAAAQWLWNYAMMANPIGLIIGLIGAMTLGIIWAWNKFEGFRGVIMGTWEVLKTFGNIIKEYVINRFKELLSGIQGIGQAILAFFRGDFSSAMNYGKQAFNELIGVGSSSTLINDTLKAGKNIGETFNKGYEEGVGMGSVKVPEAVQNIANVNKPTAATNTDIFDSLSKIPGMDNKSGNQNGSKDSKSDKAKNASKGIVSGGEKQVNITVHLQKLQDKIEIHSHNLKEGANEMEDIVKEALLRVLNSVNQMQTN